MSLEVLTAVSGVTGVFTVMIFLQLVITLSSKLAQVIEQSMKKEKSASDA